MRHRNTIFASLLKVLPQRQFKTNVKRHGGDRYVKGLRTWDQLLALIYAQLTGASSLRGLVANWNANSEHHYHLGTREVRRSTLSDANNQRPVEIFADLFAQVSARAGRVLKREGGEMVRLIDSSPIPLGQLFECARWNGRTKGMKLHVVYDPDGDHPRLVEITPANINDVNVGRDFTIEPGATYVYDKAYADYDWWGRLHDNNCIFVTRPKTNVSFEIIATRSGPYRPGDGYTVLEDALVAHATRSHNRLAMPLRLIKVQRHQDGRELTLVTNDLERPADAIATLYKTRWQIELLFRWIKQHLKIGVFLGRSENAVRIQILVAMITFLLLRTAARANGADLSAIRFAQLIGANLFARKDIAHVDKPPKRLHHPPYVHPDQMRFAC